MEREKEFGRREELGRIIDHIANRIHYAEGRRSAFSVIAGILVAAGVALLPYVESTVRDPGFRGAGFLAAIAMIILGGVLLLIYAKQTNFKYPFTQVTTTWKWFYREALPRSKEFDVHWTDYVRQNKERIEEGKRAYSTQWGDFRDNQKKWIDDDDQNLAQDLEQIYVLHVNEKYKNDFLRHLRTVLEKGIYLIFVAAVLGYFVGYWIGV